MKITRRLIRRSTLLSAAFLVLGATLFIAIQSREFAYEEASHFRSEGSAGASIVAQQYSFGDLVALRSSLDTLAKDRGWLYAQFKNQADQPIWTYDPRLETKKESSFELVIWKVFHFFAGGSKDDRLSITETFPVISESGDLDGQLTVSKRTLEEWNSHIHAALETVLAFGLFWLIFGTLSWHFTKAALNPLSQLSNELTSEAKRIGLCLDSSSDKDEVLQIRSWFSQVADEWQNAMNRSLKAERDEAVANVAQQVAHDIKSPLAALEVVLKDLNHLPEDRRIIVRSSVTRIADIANQLIVQSRSNQISTNPGSQTEVRSAQLVQSLIAEIISEKRMQFRDQIGVELEFDSHSLAYGLFASIQPREFKRILSNLINNSVEALRGPGKVTVEVSANEQYVHVAVADNGSGIAPELVPLLAQRGASFGKSSGSGLGLFHAKTSVESWGGEFTIRSELGRGTRVALSLLKESTPSWFVSELAIRPNFNLVVLDDDTAIHELWQARLDSVELSKNVGINLKKFVSSDAMKRWYRSGPRVNTLFLVDFELLNSANNGLDVIEELGLSSSSILVTSRFEEDHIRSRCKALGVPLIPKSLVATLPIRVDLTTGNWKKNSCLIDDDPLVHFAWKMSAEANGITLRSFNSVESFLEASGTIRKETPIYIDSNLGDGVKGEIIAKDIYARGFRKLFLATGYESDQFSDMPWITQVVGKDPIWQHLYASDGLNSSNRSTKT